MSLPTLLLKGNLVETGYGPKAKELDELVPIDYIMDWFDKKISREPSSKNPPGKSPADQILFIRSSTGSGKSTVMMSELFHRYYSRTRRNIACTQPRVFNAVDIPTKQVIPYNTKQKLRDAGYPDREALILEENIGYQTKAFTKKPTKGLIYMTIGVLTQQMKIMSQKDFMQRYSFIVIDEAHERSIDTDFVLLALKKLIVANYANPDCPHIIITSATFDPFKFADYMLSDVPKSERYNGIIDVKGFSHEIKDHYLEYATSDVISTAVTVALELHSRKEDLEESCKFKDILIFVSGAAEIKKIIKALESVKVDEPFVAISVTRADIQGETVNFQNITRPYKEINGKPKRRIMVATNVGETGITYPNLKYVIDTGFYNSSEYDPTLGVELLVLRPVTKGMYRQRRGRCGRNAPGEAYPLYTQAAYDNMLEDAYPEIIKEEITLNLLSLLITQVDPDSVHTNVSFRALLDKDKDADPEAAKFIDYLSSAKINIADIDLLDSPSADSWHLVLEKLYTLGAITSSSVPTPLGILMSKFSMLKIESVKMIFSSYAWKVCTADIITIAAFLEARRGDIFVGRDEKQYLSALRKGEFAIFGPEGITELLVADDFIMYLVLMHQFKTIALGELSSYIDKWAEECGIGINAVLGAIALRDEVMILMAKLGLNPYNCHQNSLSALLGAKNNIEIDDIIGYIKLVKQCIYEGYKLNIALLSPSGKYLVRRTHLPLELNKPTIGIVPYSDDNPHVILYDKIRYMRSQIGDYYEPHIDNISVLDGYVPYDYKF